MRISETGRIEGRANQRPAVVEVDARQVRWRARKGQLHPTPEEFDLPLPELRVFAWTEERWSSVSTLGTFLIALGVLWQAYGTATLAVSAAFVGAGLVGILSRRWNPLRFLTIATSDRVLVLQVRSRSHDRCRKIVAALQRERPELDAGRSPGLSTSLASAARGMFSSRSSLRKEFRSLAGTAATPDEEVRFLCARRRISAWLLGWVVALPVVGALAARLFLPSQPVGWLLVRVATWAVFLAVIGGLLQARLVKSSRRIRRWLAGDPAAPPGTGRR